MKSLGNECFSGKNQQLLKSLTFQRTYDMSNNLVLFCLLSIASNLYGGICTLRAIWFHPEVGGRTAWHLTKTDLQRMAAGNER